MAAPERVRVTHTFTSDPATVFDALSEHENLGPMFGARVERVRDGETERNGVGSARSLKIGPLPAFEETTTRADRPMLIEYEITKGGPLKGHWARQQLTGLADGGTRLDYAIGFNLAVPVPLLPGVVAKVLQTNISKGLRKLVP